MKDSVYTDLELLMVDHLHQLNNFTTTLDAVAGNELKLSQADLKAGLVQISNQIKTAYEKLDCVLAKKGLRKEQSAPAAGVEHALEAILRTLRKPHPLIPPVPSLDFETA